MTIAVVFPLIICAVVAFVVCCAHYSYKSYIRSFVIITFDEFKSMYALAPSKWGNQLGGNGEWYCARYYDGDGWENCYMPNLWEQAKLRRFFNKIYKQNQDKRSVSRKEKLLKLWKEDVEEYKKKAYKEARDQLRANGIAIFTDDQMRFLREVLKNIDKDMTDEEIEKAVNSINLTEYVCNGGKG